MKAPSHRLRFGVALALGAAATAWFAHASVSDARRRIAAEAEDRKAVVSLRALETLVRALESPPEEAEDEIPPEAEPQADLEEGGGAGAAEDPGERIRAAIAAWQAKTPDAAQVRLVRGMTLEASSAPGDEGDRAAPRRLVREEKPLYDRGQRLATSVQTNEEEGGARRDEIEVEVLEGGRLSLALPLEDRGMLELVTTPRPRPPATGWPMFLLAFAAPVVVFAGASFAVGERRWPLAAVALAALAITVVLLLAASARLIVADRGRAAQDVSARAREQAELLRSIAEEQGAAAPEADLGAWDADRFRRPRGELGADGAPNPERLAGALAESVQGLRRSLLWVGAIALAFVLVGGAGVFNAVGRAFWKNRQAYAYVAPAMIGMLALVFYPFSYGIVLSFTDSNLYNTNESIPEIWIGLRNYVEILTDVSFGYSSFYYTLLFTIFWTVTNVAIGVTSGLILALILNTRGLALRPIYRVLLILPWAMPNYITALVWKGMFHQQFGVINQALQMIGLPAVNWFDRPFTSFLTALATNGWLSFPFMMVVSLGALQSIPGDLYEAARVDGATRWQQFKAITLPSLRPALVPAVILSVVWTFNMFNIIYLVTAGEPAGSTEILITQAYKFAFERYRYGYAAAYSTVIFLLLFVYGMFQIRVTKATEA